MNINQEVIINNVHLCLENFSKALDEKKYAVRVEYKIWRKLSKAQSIKLGFESGNSVYIHAQTDDIVFTTVFNTYDNGFGQYLFDTYYNKEVYMNTNTNAIKINTDQDLCYTNTATTTSNINWNEYSTTGNASYDWLKNIPVTIDYGLDKTVKEEENNMNANKMFNFDFGPCGDTIRMSMYGLAVKNQAGEWVSYDSNNGEIVNVDVFNIAEGGKWFYKMPVSVDDIAVGDLLIHAKKPCYVVDFNENTLNPIVIDIFSMERKEILLQKNMFGFNFATKVVSLFDGFGGEKPSAKNPFGNMLPFFFMSNRSGDIDPMLMFMMMQGQNGPENTSAFGSPLMMYLMMKGHTDFDMLPLMLIMNQQQKK